MKILEFFENFRKFLDILENIKTTLITENDEKHTKKDYRNSFNRQETTKTIENYKQLKTKNNQKQLDTTKND